MNESICRFVPYHVFALVISLFISFDSFSQKQCATVFHEKAALKNHKRSKNDFENWLLKTGNIRRENSKALRTKEDLIYTIPVVIHVIHRGESEGVGTNIPNSQIFSQLDILNEDFRRLNPDTVDTPLAFRAVAADIGIEFVLAKSDPDGNPTTGINRKAGAQNQWDALKLQDDLNLKAEIYWPAEDYLNIWVTDLASFFLGYASFPETTLPGINESETDRLLDGLVIDYEYMGEGGNTDNFSRGRTVTHEIGHFLGLRHLDGDPDFNEQGCEIDDFVTDTPLSTKQTSGCPSDKQSCGSLDMIQNYMDFTNDVCMNIFTLGQKARMRQVLENSPRRMSLTKSPGLIAPVTGIDLSISKIVNPKFVSCYQSLIPQIEIINSGEEDSGSFEFSVKIDNAPASIHSGSSIGPKIGLKNGPNNTTIFTLDEIALEDGQHHIKIEIITPDEDNSNNTAELSFVIDNTTDFIPLILNFENNAIDEGWFTNNPDNNLTWSTAQSTIANTNNRYFATINSFFYGQPGQIDYLISPLLDFSNSQEASLKFIVSYATKNFRKERLEILASKDCDADFKIVYSAQGDSLAGNKTSEEEWIPEKTSDWERPFIDLSEFAGYEAVRVAFKLTNDFGNNIYVDNIEFLQSSSNTVVSNENTFLTFPNPTSDQTSIQINLLTRQDLTVSLFDSTGKLVFSNELENVLNQTYNLDLSTRPDGMYFLKIQNTTFNYSDRIIKNSVKK